MNLFDKMKVLFEYCPQNFIWNQFAHSNKKKFLQVICLLVLLAIAVNGSTIRKIRETSANAPAIETGKDLLPEGTSDDLETAETFYKKVYGKQTSSTATIPNST